MRKLRTRGMRITEFDLEGAPRGELIISKDIARIQILTHKQTM